MIRKYHNHKPQTTPWHREEEPLKEEALNGSCILKLRCDFAITILNLGISCFENSVDSKTVWSGSTLFSTLLVDTW